jgi:hypothetical protein
VAGAAVASVCEPLIQELIFDLDVGACTLIGLAVMKRVTGTLQATAARSQHCRGLNTPQVLRQLCSLFQNIQGVKKKSQAQATHNCGHRHCCAAALREQPCLVHG